MSTSSASRADTFGATSGATPGTSIPGFEVLISPTVPNSFSFNSVTGGPGTQPGARPFQGAPRRLKSIDGMSSGSHVRKTNTPFFACSGVRPWTPVMAFLTEATPAHKFGSMKNPLPSKTTRLPLSVTPDTASRGLRTLDLGMSVELTCRTHRVVRYGLLLSFLTDCLSFQLQGPHIVVLSLSPLTVSEQHLVIRVDSQLILLHWSQL